MDEESKQLLREIRDLMRQTYERESEWREEIRESTKRGRKTGWFMFMLAIVFIIATQWRLIASFFGAE